MKTAGKILLLLMVGVASVCSAHRYRSLLPSVDSTGFYKIQLTPEVNAKLKNNFSDLRLYDQDKKEVPYFLKDDSPVITSSRFKEYPIVSRVFLKDSVTQIILQNTDAGKMNNISLVIRNADVQKAMSLAGSFDRKQWYVVKASDTFSSISNTKEVSEMRLINFPLTNYTYYKIEINDRFSPPIDVIKAGSYETTTRQGAYTSLPVAVSFADSIKSKTTWVHIVLDQSYLADVLEMDVTAPKYYARNLNIYVNDSRGLLKKLLLSTAINSNAPFRIDLQGTRTRDFWIEIFNADNPILKISDARIFQLNHYCIASLEQHKHYEIHFSDSLLQAPVYDLGYFQSAIPENLKVLLPGGIIEVKQDLKAEEKSSFSIFSDKRFIWTALVLVVLLLAWATNKMIKELN